MRKILVTSCILVSLSVISVLYITKSREQLPARQGKTPSVAAIQIPFVKNMGQAHGDVAFYTELKGGALFVKHDGSLVYSLAGKKEGVFTSIVERPQKYSSISVKGRDHADVRLNFFRGKDRNKWRSNVPSFKSVSLGRLAPDIDIDLVYRPGTFEKIFRVGPGGDPAGISMRIDGARKITALPDGRLEVKTSLGEVLFSKPAAHQNINGNRREVEVAYNISGSGYGFTVGDYDRSRELVIDPILSTYVGGTGTEQGNAIDTYLTDEDELYIYIAGTINFASGFPAADEPGGIVSGGGTNGEDDAFVARMNYDFSSYIVTYLGSETDEEALDLAVNPETGDVFVVGYTSGDFPMTGTTDFGRGGGLDGFVACLSNDLSTLQYSRYLGGSEYDAATAITIENRDDPVRDLVYVTGSTRSDDFPGVTEESPQPECASCTSISDGFVAIMDSDLEIVKSTYLGGCSTDNPLDIAVSPVDHSIFVAGNTHYNGPWLVEHGGEYVGCFPWIADADTYGGQAFDAFLVRFNDLLSNDTDPVAVYHGGNMTETANALFIENSSGEVFMTGWTACATTAGTNDADFPFPASPSYTPAYATCAGGSDAFVARFDPGTLELIGGTLFGGVSSDYATDVYLKGSSVYISGKTYSLDLPDTVGGADPNLEHSEVMLVRFTSDLTEVEQATYLGGSGYEESPYKGLVIIDDPAEGWQRLLVTGQTSSDDFPGIPDTDGFVPQRELGGGSDAFIAMLPVNLKYAVGPGDIDVNQPDIYFGNWPAGSTNYEVLEIQNVGGEALTVSSLTLTGGDDFSVSTTGTGSCGAAPFTLGSGESCNLYLYFAVPADTGSITRWNDTLVIGSDDTDEPSVSVPLEGWCEQDVRIAPSSLTFPETAVGASFKKTVTLYNDGPVALTIDGYEVDPTLDTPAGTYAFGLGTILGVSLPLSECVIDLSEEELELANASRDCTAVVTFSPIVTGDGQDATITVTSNDPDESISYVTPTGTGVAASEAPVIHVQGYDFRDVAIGDSSTYYILVSNTGGTALQLWDYDISDPAFTLDFEGGARPCGAEAVDNDNMLLPYALLPVDPIDDDTGYCTVGVTWSPTSAHPDGVSAELTLESNDPATPQATVTFTGRSSPDTDGDGVLDIEEPGDANGDGFLDSGQAESASLHSYDGENVVTLEAEGGASFEDLRSDISFEGTPDNVEFPFGCFRFTLVLPGGETEGTVVMTVPSGIPVSTYYKYGREVGNTDYHVYDLGDYPGAVDINGSEITLHLVDGGAGDSDLSVNGRIVDPGAPAYVHRSGHKSSGGGGCSSSTASAGGQSETVYAGLVLLFGWGLMRRRMIRCESGD